MGTGVEKVAVCHPLADSLEKVTSASLVPLLVQSVPICVPLLPGLFQKRMLLIKPFSEDRNLSPRLSDCPSSPTAAAGVIEAGHIQVEIPDVGGGGGGGGGSLPPVGEDSN